jgi:hypothetical protein
MAFRDETNPALGGDCSPWSRRATKGRSSFEAELARLTLG